MPSYIDIAVNLIGSPLEKECDTLIDDAAAQGVSPLIVIGSNLPESEKAIDFSARYQGALYTTAGVHPHHASEWNAASREQLIPLAGRSGVVAIGECGLDYNRDFSPRPKQREAFEAQQQADQERAFRAGRQATLREQYVATIAAVVTDNWLRPPTAQAGLRCTVRVVQIPGGEVISSSLVGSCNGDEATRRSILAAVDRTGVLPYRGFEDVFSREIEFIFTYSGD